VNEELKKKLLADIDKSGFGSEMRAVKTFWDKNWNCAAGVSYVDHDEGKMRTIDLVASNWVEDKTQGVTFSLIFYAEVKKTERPWIVFKYKDDPRSLFLDESARSYICRKTKMPFDLCALDSIMQETSFRKKCGWIARGMHEAFKEPSQPSRWYSAFVSVCKACEDNKLSGRCCYDDEAMTNAFGSQLVLDLYNPIVIVDGPLMSVNLANNGKFNLQEISYAPFVFDFESPQYDRVGRYRVDLVAPAHLEKYIALCEIRLQKVAETMAKIYAPFRKKQISKLATPTK
jgi:hypothetical protein